MKFTVHGTDTAGKSRKAIVDAMNEDAARTMGERGGLTGVRVDAGLEPIAGPIAPAAPPLSGPAYLTVASRRLKSVANSLRRFGQASIGIGLLLLLIAIALMFNEDRSAAGTMATGISAVISGVFWLAASSFFQVIAGMGEVMASRTASYQGSGNG